MKQFWYKVGTKCAGVCLQGLLVGVLGICIMISFYWLEESLGFGEMGKSFEETEVFLRHAQNTVNRKLDYDRNIELFEFHGAFDGTQEIDIRQYDTGAQDEANLNVNTTYYISDLLAFGENGRQQMEDTIYKLLDSGLSSQEISIQLDEQAPILETVFPVSGNTLADFARMNVNGTGMLLEYYQELCATARDIQKRYEQYLKTKEETEGEDNSAAPSNISYYIENTRTRQRYTNLNVKSLAAARRMIQNSAELEFLFEGERRFNIMVANSEYIMNDEVARWFINTRFLGSGEKVLLAVNTSYPIGDSLQEIYRAYEQRVPVLLGCMIIGLIGGVVLIMLVVLSIITTGRKEKDGAIYLNWFDKVPTEIAAGLCLIAALLWYFFIMLVRKHTVMDFYPRRTFVIGAVVVEYWILLFSLLSLVRRMKAKTLWENSVSYVVVLVCRQVYNAKQGSKRLVIAYLVFFALNIVFLGFFDTSGAVMALVLDMAVLLYLMRDEVGKQSIREGLYQISQGKLDYKVDTTVLSGETLEMAEAVNEMGDGLQLAIDSMIKNERLKAELITNVSHDIKTPLTSIINYVDLLKRENLQNDRAKEYIRILEQKSQRLKQLTEDLIEASKISSGNIELQCAPLKLQQMLYQAYGEFSERLEEQHLEPVLLIEKEPLIANVDGRQLWRVFENLLSNIAKYALPETRVYMELKRTDQLAEITFKNVSRQKIQVGAEELQERFVRGDISRSTEGSGLGLSIAKSLTELMDGSFDVYLDGDFFQVTLLFPLYEEQV